MNPRVPFILTPAGSLALIMSKTLSWRGPDYFLNSFDILDYIFIFTYVEKNVFNYSLK
jgi:hypothetical protein